RLAALDAAKLRHLAVGRLDRRENRALDLTPQRGHVPLVALALRQGVQVGDAIASGPIGPFRHVLVRGGVFHDDSPTWGRLRAVGVMTRLRPSTASHPRAAKA